MGGIHSDRATSRTEQLTQLQEGDLADTPSSPGATPHVNSTADAHSNGAIPHTYCFFSALYPPSMGGVERYTVGMAAELAERGHRVIVVTSRIDERLPSHEVQADGVEVYRLPCRSLLKGRLPVSRRTADYERLWNRLSQSGVERVVINTRFYRHSLEGARLAHEMGVPALIVEHGSAHLTMGNTAADASVHSYEHHITRRIMGYGFPFCAVSVAAVEWLRHFDITACGIVPNALDAYAFAAGDSGRDFRRESSLGASTFVVAFTGRLIPEKGIDALVQAARLCAGEDIVFLVAGDGPLQAAVEAAGANVRGLGRLDGGDIAALLRCSDALCLPSRSEGFATSLLEAAAMGTVPVVTQVGGTDELGIPDVGGVLLEDARAETIAEAIRSLAGDPAACHAAGVRLQQRVRQENTWARSADALERLFADAPLASSVQADSFAPVRSSSPSPVAVASAAVDAASVPPVSPVSEASRVSVPVATSAPSVPTAPSAPASPASSSPTQPACAAPTPTFSDERLESLHRVLLMMLKDFAHICELEGVCWFANYGTVIGALRHRGFIPWDDDVDLCLPRADLDRLTAAVNERYADTYAVIDSRIDPRYPMATSRFMLKGTEFRDGALAGMDFDSGIFLDLFPLDNLADDEKSFKRQLWRAWLYNKFALMQLVENPHIGGTGLRSSILRAGTKVAQLLLKAPMLRSIDFNARSYAELTRFNTHETRRIGYPCDTSRFWTVYDREKDVFPLRQAPFEDMQIPIGQHAEDFLSTIYGDYMTPLPESERYVHYPDVLDLGPYA